jgi:hypothetical protein
MLARTYRRATANIGSNGGLFNMRIAAHGGPKAHYALRQRGDYGQQGF